MALYLRCNNGAFSDISQNLISQPIRITVGIKLNNFSLSQARAEIEICNF